MPKNNDSAILEHNATKIVTKRTSLSTRFVVDHPFSFHKGYSYMFGSKLCPHKEMMKQSKARLTLTQEISWYSQLFRASPSYGNREIALWHDNSAKSHRNMNSHKIRLSLLCEGPDKGGYIREKIAIRGFIQYKEPIQSFNMLKNHYNYQGKLNLAKKSKDRQWQVKPYSQKNSRNRSFFTHPLDQAYF